MASLRKSLLSRAPKRLSSMPKDFTPVKWSKYFDRKQEVTINDNNFNVYIKGDTGPVLVTLHGGGYSALTWALFAEEITTKIDCQVLAIDLRGHGLTKTSNDVDLSLETLSSDVSAIINNIFSEKLLPIVLIGHSMGGAVAVEASYLIQSVVAVCVIDVVEGSALESLCAMQSILRGRPTSFKTVEQAIQWSFRSGQTHNLEAARVSMPGQIKNITTNILASEECCQVTCDSVDELGIEKVIHQLSADSIVEEEEEKTDSLCTSNIDAATSHEENEFAKPIDVNMYTWRIDLSKTESFWTGWFKGLSQKFLNVPTPKVLLLANIHGLDTALTIGQMQGKFQFQVLPRSGHAIHEDQPQNVADIISGFLVKQKLTTPKEGFVPLMPAC